MIAGFELPTTGTIVVNGEDITHRPPNQRNVGMVFQSYALFPNMTVADNIGFGLKIARTPKADIDRTVAEMLDVIHLPELGNRYPHQLSGGQQQRVALARALAIQPQVLLLDEPLSALDAKIRVELRPEIRRIQRQLGITTIYVTHDQEEALSLSDRIVVMNEGRVEQVGTPFEIYNYPKTGFVASFIGQLNLLPVTVRTPRRAKSRLAARARRRSGPRSRSSAAKGRRCGWRSALRRSRSTAAGAAIADDIRQLPRRHGGERDFPGRDRAGQGRGGRLHRWIVLSVDLFNDRQLVLPRPASRCGWCSRSRLLG